MKALLDFLYSVLQFLWRREAEAEGFFSTYAIALEIFCMRLLCSALAVSFLCGIVMLVRNKLLPLHRSWLWGLCFMALFIPFEQSITVLLFYDLNLAPLSAHMSSNLYWMLSYSQQVAIRLWFTGFLFFSVKTFMARIKTRRLIKAGKIPGCAAYFYLFRSHIYLPADFESAHSPNEQEMLLAHERQHIKQHDPFLYWLLQAMQCVYWFCPVFHKAVHLFRRDRELLCDERVTQNYPCEEYGMLILKEAKKMALSPRMMVGIVSSGNVSERIATFVSSFPGSRKLAAVTLCAVSVVLTAGAVRPAYRVLDTPRIIVDFRYDENSLRTVWTDSNTEQMKQYIIPGPDGAAFDQEGMYEYAIASGIRPEQHIYIAVIRSNRPVLFNAYASGGIAVFEIADLKSKTIELKYEAEPPIANWITRKL